MKNSSLFKMLVVAIALQSAQVSAIPLTAQERSLNNWSDLLLRYQANPDDKQVRALIARHYDEDLANGNEATKTFLKDVVGMFGGKENIEKMKLDNWSPYLKSWSPYLKSKVNSGLSYVKNNPKKSAGAVVAMATVAGFFAAYKKGYISKDKFNKTLKYVKEKLVGSTTLDTSSFGLLDSSVLSPQGAIVNGPNFSSTLDTSSFSLLDTSMLSPQNTDYAEDVVKRVLDNPSNAAHYVKEKLVGSTLDTNSFSSLDSSMLSPQGAIIDTSDIDTRSFSLLDSSILSPQNTDYSGDVVEKALDNPLNDAYEALGKYLDDTSSI